MWSSPGTAFVELLIIKFTPHAPTPSHSILRTWEIALVHITEGSDPDAAKEWNKQDGKSKTKSPQIK